MRFRLLGSLVVETDDGPVCIAGPRRRALLATLLLHANELVPTQRLIEEIWGEDTPPTAEAALYVHVAALRRILHACGGDAALDTRSPGYVLAADPLEIDVRAFERLVTMGGELLRGEEFGAAEEAFRDALSLWRGPALVDVGDEPWIRAEAARLDELRLVALEGRFESELRSEPGVELVSELEAQVAADPLRERFWAQLMLALYRAGRQAEALDAYRDARAALVGSRGIEPGAELRELQRAILAQDPALVGLPRDGTTAASAQTADALRVRKEVTIALVRLEADLRRSDPEAAARALDEAFAAVSRVLAGHGATVERLLDSRVLAVFGHPIVREDDAVRALGAADEVRRLLARPDRTAGASGAIKGAVAVESGELVIESGDGRPLELVGAAVERVARLVTEARDGDVLVGARARDLVRGCARLAPRRTKGTVEAWNLQSVDAQKALRSISVAAPLVGRERELGKLLGAFRAASAERRPRRLTLVGPAGVGKSRLAYELSAALYGEAQTVTGRCSAYGDGITLLPLADILRQVTGGVGREAIGAFLSDPADGEGVAAVLAGSFELSGSEPSRDELPWAVRRFFEALARRRPTLVILEDAQWAQPTLLDLIENVVQSAQNAPVVFLRLERTEPVTHVQRRARGGDDVLEIEPLSKAESTVLLGHLLPPDAGGEDRRPLILDNADGNPLFIEELARQELETPVDAAERVPATIKAILGNRVDLLERAERELLEVAAVVGKRFSRRELSALVPDRLRATLTLRLDRLRTRDFIRPMSGGAGRFEFKHDLIREIVYASIAKERRADLHLAHAEWLERAESDVADCDTLAGHHLERAHRYWVELGRPAAESSAVAARAGRALAAGGHRAYKRGDTPAAVRLLGLAAPLLQPDDDDRLHVLADLAEALIDAGEFAQARAVLSDLAAGPALHGAYAAVASVRLRLRTEAAVRADTLVAGVDEALAALEELGHERGLARAWAVRAWLPWLSGRAAEAEQAAERGLEYAERTGDTRARQLSLHLLAGAMLYGPRPVPLAARRCRRIIEENADSRVICASAMRALAGLEALRGRFREARKLIERDRDVLRELGQHVTSLAASTTYGSVELRAGNLEGAERELRYALNGLRRLRETTILADVAGCLARVLYEQERFDEARQLTDVAERTAAPEITAQVEWRRTRARLAADVGDHACAVELAEKALRLADSTEFPILRGDTRMDVAAALRRAGRPEQARSAVAEALALYEGRAASVPAHHARSELETA